MEGGDSQKVRLPDTWNGSGRSGTWRYLLTFDAPGLADQGTWALYIPRAGNRFAVDLNGERIGQLGNLRHGQSDYAQRPHFFFVPAKMLRPQGNELRIVVQGEKARYAGLSTVRVGPAETLQHSFTLREAAQVWGSFAIILLSLVFAVVSLGASIRLRDRSIGIFFAACLFCAVRTSYAVVINPPLDYRLWSAIIDGCYAGYLAALCLLCVETLGLHRRWISLATVGLFLSTLVLLPLYAWWRMVEARQLLLNIMVLYGSALCLAVIVRWWRSRTSESAYLALAGAVSIGLALYDHLLVFYDSNGYGAFAFARYSLIIFLVAMGVLLAERYARQLQHQTELRMRVENELRTRGAELERHFDQQQQLAARKAQQHERQLLLQDLHDGMGLQLHGLLGMLQNGPLERQELTREVRTAIEQMRMLIDSADGFDGDVSILMGDIRYRIEQRLKRSGIHLQWQALLLQPNRALRPDHAIALQRLVFEWVTNTLKHSGASLASFHALDDAKAEGGLFILYEDDGCGFEGAAVSSGGMGMRSIERRVADLGARLNLSTAEAKGVRYSLWIPASSFGEGVEKPLRDIASSG